SNIPLGEQKILRIVLGSIGDVDLGGPNSSDDGFVELCKFLHSVRGLLRYSFATCIMSIPACLYDRMHLVRINHMVDSVLHLQSYGATDTSYFAKQYHGVMKVIKLARLNHLMMAAKQISDEMGFKCKRRSLIFETMHLPPELGDEVSRSQGTSVGEGAV